MTPDLAEQLLTGSLSRVFVFGGLDHDVSMLGLYLPQTLGLPPVTWRAHRLDENGFVARRTAEELARIAEPLAAGDRWIAEGLPTAWAVPFMERAEAIIWFDVPETRFRVGTRFGSGRPQDVLAKYLWLQARRRRARSHGVEWGPTGTAPKWWSVPLDGKGAVGHIAENQFAQKLFRASTQQQIDDLRAVRSAAHDD